MSKIRGASYYTDKDGKIRRAVDDSLVEPPKQPEESKIVTPKTPEVETK